MRLFSLLPSESNFSISLYMLEELSHLVSFLIPFLYTKSVSSQCHILLAKYLIQGTNRAAMGAPLGSSIMFLK